MCVGERCSSGGVEGGRGKGRGGGGKKKIWRRRSGGGQDVGRTEEGRNGGEEEAAGEIGERTAKGGRGGSEPETQTQDGRVWGGTDGGQEKKRRKKNVRLPGLLAGPPHLFVSVSLRFAPGPFPAGRDRVERPQARRQEKTRRKKVGCGARAAEATPSRRRLLRGCAFPRVGACAVLDSVLRQERSQNYRPG